MRSSCRLLAQPPQPGIPYRASNRLGHDLENAFVARLWGAGAAKNSHNLRSTDPFPGQTCEVAALTSAVLAGTKGMCIPRGVLE